MSLATLRLPLWWLLVRQDLAARYRGTLLGRAWPLMLPLLLLAVYGFVFGTVFRSRWPGLAEGDDTGFALLLFSGLLTHGLLAEVLGQAPSLLLRNSNFVRKVVFPLPVLVAVPLGSALWHALLGYGLLWLAHGLSGGVWALSALALPVILLPYLLLLYGLGLGLAALGVYLRDLSQIAPALATLALFSGAVFYPVSMVPPALAPLLQLNPITWPVSAIREALLLGHWPDPAAWAVYSAIAVLVLALGAWLFRSLQRGFADVL